MVLQRRETDEEQEMITVFTNYKRSDKPLIEKIITFYQFLKDEDFINFANHLQIACDICHQQAFELIELIKDIFANFPQQNQDSLKNALQSTFRQGFFEKSGYFRASTFNGLLCRNNFISQQYVLDTFMEYLNSEEVIVSQRSDMYIIQVLFWSGDILNQYNRKTTSKILKRLERRGYPVHTLFKNDFQIAHDLNTEGLNPFTDYYCFKYDDVSYLQKQASSPNFDVNRYYEVPIWELDLIRYKEIPLISAAAFYGAEKCFRYLQLTGASCIIMGNPTFHRFRPGPAVLAAIVRESRNKDAQGKEYLYSYAGPIFLRHNWFLRAKFDNFGPAEFAIAGNNIKILHTILQDNDDALVHPLIMAAAYNRVKEFDWLRTRSTIEKETQENLITSLVFNDNEIMFRKLLREDFLNPDTSSLYIMQAPRCTLELISRYLSNYNSSLGNLFQYRQNLVFNVDMNQKKNPIMDQIYNRATPAITNEKNLENLKMLLNKREFDVEPNALFGDPGMSLTNDNIPDECAKELLLSDDMETFFEKVGRNYLVELIQANKFSIVEWALQQEKIIKKYTMEQLAANSNSLEMRNLIKKCFNK